MSESRPFDHACTSTPSASPQHSLISPSQDPLQRPQDPVPGSPAVSTNPPSSIVAGSLPSLTTILRTYIPTLQHVPKGARGCWWALSDCLLSVANNPADLTHLCKLFMLSKCVWASPAAAHRLPWLEILQQVRSRLRRWSAGDLLSLWMEAVDIGQTMSRRQNSSVASPSTQRNYNAKRARRAVQDGLYSNQSPDL